MFVNEYHPPFLKAYKHARDKLRVSEPEFGYHVCSAENFSLDKGKAELSYFLKEARRKDSLVGFVGGPPCPDFSVGGKNRGRHGDNGKLSLLYAHLIVEQQPDFFLFENVKGLLRTKRHREFYEEIKKVLLKGDYHLTERLINSIEYGVPQDRDRIILLGFNKRIFGSAHDESGSLPFEWYNFMSYPDRSAFEDFNWPTTNSFGENSSIPIPDNVPISLTVEGWFRKNNVDNHPNSQHCFTPRSGMSKFLTIQEGDDSGKSYKRLHRWRYSPTAAYGNNEVHLHPYKPRRISVAEALAVQSLPKNFSFPDDMTLTNMFKAIGNGVPYLAAKGIAQSLKAFLENETNYCQSSQSNREFTQEPVLQLR